MKKLEPVACKNPHGETLMSPEASPVSIDANGGKVLTKRRRGLQVDGAIGIGHPKMPPEHIARGLARIIRRGVRTAQVREIAGVSLVYSREIPAGTFALRTADRITAYRSETAVPIVEVPYAAIGILLATASNS